MVPGMKNLLVACFALIPSAGPADPPVVAHVMLSDGYVHVTLTHPDSGWDHYADTWRVYAPGGKLVAERILLHPHEHEQPFTRSAPISLPAGTTHLSVVAECSLGDASETFEHPVESVSP